MSTLKSILNIKEVTLHVYTFLLMHMESVISTRFKYIKHIKRMVSCVMEVKCFTGVIFTTFINTRIVLKLQCIYH